MKTETGEALERLVVEHRRRVAEVRADEALSWEKKELAIRRLGQEYDKTRKQVQEDA